jgi:hypothetical protein
MHFHEARPLAKSFGSGKPAKAAVESPKGQMPGLTRNFQQQTVGKATS